MKGTFDDNNNSDKFNYGMHCWFNNNDLFDYYYMENCSLFVVEIINISNHLINVIWLH